MGVNESEGRLYHYGDVAAAEDDGFRRDSLNFGVCEEACACDMPGAMSMPAKLQKTITASRKKAKRYLQLKITFKF